MMLLLGFELTIYCWCLLGLSLPLHKYARLISDAALEIPPWTLFLAATIPLGLSVFIFAQYGFSSLIPAAGLAESAGLPTWIRYVNDFLILQGWGAAYCCSIRMAHRRYGFAIIPALAFVLSRMFFESGEGKRYFLIVVATFVFFRDHRPLRITAVFVASMLAMAIATFATWSWYEGTRANLVAMFNAGMRYDSTLDMLEDLVTPRYRETSSVDAVLNRQLQGRAPPILLLTMMVKHEGVAGGIFVEQAVLNAVPAIGDKRFRHENEVFANDWGYPFDDYGWTVLTELQAEASVFAAIATPVVYAFLFWLCWLVVAHWRGRSNLIVIAAIGVAVFHAGEIQTDLTIVFAHIRALAAYLTLGFALWHLRQIPRLRRRRAYLAANMEFAPSRE